ncbi:MULTISPECIES: hypothetical protein [unclassified Burkholderia]|uniref:hypothetical protein n=1 Tax=unclassified Burkholderia TaxID=2613784 RepID=UPI00141D856D|nr:MULTISPECIES: hypothetical protein [unclassified Burkholderia]NIE55800.1 hypothetical protein [Burkholderia sp. Ap-955]NIF11267.1 hypothetical protein [Burkholderia sp. Ax-1735]NIG05229.1 hypothetical protein [Burkholderia sp. Tr-849]
MSLTLDSTFRVATVRVAEAFDVQCDIREADSPFGITCDSRQSPSSIDAARERMSAHAWKSPGKRGRIASSTYAGRGIASGRAA